jgi:hypothetical protein
MFNPQNLNRYSYVRNNPINYNDPSGHVICNDEGVCFSGNKQVAKHARSCADWDDCSENKKRKLQKELDEFVPLETVNTSDMITVKLFGQSQTLTPGEYALLLDNDGKIDRWLLLRMGSIFMHALNQTSALFPGESLHNSRADAFRHSYWNALITQEFGAEYAQAFTTKHETSPGSVREEQFMDLHNNSVGRDIGLSYPNLRPEQIQQKVMDALTNGQLYVWDGENIYFSNQCPSCLGGGY